VARVEVSERGRLGDGHVAVVPTSESAVLDGVSRPARLSARLNRLLYDAPLGVPFGPATVVSVVDVYAAMARLADGRVPVVRLDAEPAEPRPTVELTSADEPTVPILVDANQLAAEELATTVAAADEDEPAAEELVTTVAAADEDPDVDESQPARPAQPVFAARVVSAFRSRPARRAEVTVPFAHEPATEGMLALSDEPDHQQRPLPEDAELRYRPGRPDVEPTQGDVRGAEPAVGADVAVADRGHVALIVDAAAEAGPSSGPSTDADSQSSGLRTSDLVIGAQLTEAREYLGMSVDDLAERTRIRPYVIESLEVDDFAPCGGDFYARGHLRMLARVLGLDPEAVLAKYDAHFATSPVSPREVFEVELASGTTGMIRGSAGGNRWGGLIAAVLVTLLVWGVAQYFLADNDPVSDAPTIPQNPAGLGSPGAGNPKQPPVSEPFEAQVKATAVGGDSQIVVRDGAGDVVFRGVLSDGEYEKLKGEAPLRVEAADAGVIELSIRGRSLGMMGEPGESATTRIQYQAPPENPRREP
jgi:hypothetical protein